MEVALSRTKLMSVCAVPVGDVGKLPLHGKRVGEATKLADGICSEYARSRPGGGRRRRRGNSSTTSTTSTCRPVATSTALREVSPRRSTTRSRSGDCGVETRQPRDEPRPRTEPLCGTVSDGAELAGGGPSGGAGPGDDPGEDTSLNGTWGLTSPGGAGLSSSGVPPEVPGALLAGVDPAGASPRSRLVASHLFSRSSIADRSPTASPTARSGESESAEWLEV